MTVIYRTAITNVNAPETTRIIPYLGGTCIHHCPTFYSYRLGPATIELAQHGGYWSLVVTSSTPDGALNGIARLGYTTDTLTVTPIIDTPAYT